MIMMPGAETLVKTFGATAGGREDVIKLLKDGHLVGVAPGHSDPKINNSVRKFSYFRVFLRLFPITNFAMY